MRTDQLIGTYTTEAGDTIGVAEEAGHLLISIGAAENLPLVYAGEQIWLADGIDLRVEFSTKDSSNEARMRILQDAPYTTPIVATQVFATAKQVAT